MLLALNDTPSIAFCVAGGHGTLLRNGYRAAEQSTDRLQFFSQNHKLTMTGALLKQHIVGDHAGKQRFGRGRGHHLNQAASSVWRAPKSPFTEWPGHPRKPLSRRAYSSLKELGPVRPITRTAVEKRSTVRASKWLMSPNPPAKFPTIEQGTRLKC